MSADNDYAKTNQSDPVPVDADEDLQLGDDDVLANEGTDNAEDPNPDATLQQDEEEAIDKSNIINERTRGAAPSEGYREPGDDEGLPGPEDGTSSTDVVS